MKTETELPEVNITKKMKEKMKLYEVTLRKKPSIVTHMTYGRKTEVSPSVFALFEIALKANYVAWMLFYSEDPNGLLGTMHHNEHICEQCRPQILSLPYVTDEQVENRETEGRKHEQNYHWACQALRRIELYHDLLD